MSGTVEAHSSSSPLYTLNTSSYNSLRGQTDSSPWTTATGTRTRPGVLAMSRDMLRSGLPHGTRLLAVKQYGCGLNVVGRTFWVEDTMGRGRFRAADIWMSTRSQSRVFGRCIVTFRKL